jgi:hypothetical protein
MSAGKGDKPRPIDRKKYDENYDRIFRKKRTITEWQKIRGDVILDYDGFREYNRDDLLDEQTYENGLSRCTIQFKPINK